MEIVKPSIVEAKPVIDMEFLKKRPLSYSSLSAFKKSPAHYITYLTKPWETTPALTMGSLIDCMVLTPEDTENRFVIQPKIDRRSNAGKEEYEKFILANQFKQFISEEDWDKAEKIRDEIYKNAASTAILQRFNQTQKSFNWEDKETGLPMIAKLDLVGDEDIGDLKSTINGHPDEFGKSCFNYGYHLQAAIYLEAMALRGKYPTYWMVAVEKVEPYAIGVYKVSNDFIKQGKEDFHKLLQSFAFCMKENLWNQTYDFHSPIGRAGFGFAHFPLDLPPWARRKN